MKRVLLISFLLCCGLPAFSQTFVQMQDNSSHVADATIGKAITLTSGNFLWGVCAWVGTTQTVSSVAGANNTYTLVGSVFTANGYSVQLFYKYNLVAGAETVTCTLSSATTAVFKGIALHEYSGMTNSSPLDQNSHASTTGSTTVNCGTLTTTVATELLAAAAVVDGGVQTAGSGYTLRENDTNFGSNGTLDRFVSSTAAYTPTFVQSPSGNATCAAASFAVSSSSPAAPTITLQPANTTINYNATATLTTAATGNPNPTVQWYNGNSGDTSSPVGGATNASFTTPALTSNHNYWARWTNSQGTADTTTATVTVTQSPVITVQPASQSVVSGNTATLSVTAVGAPSLTYQWYLGTNNDTSNPVGGATSSSYTTPALTVTTTYWVQVTNGSGSANSSNAVLTIGTFGWTGVLDSSRAIDWTAMGVVGGIPTNRTQCGSTIAAYTGSAATINSAIAACGANQYVLLGNGTFNLSSGIDFAHKSNVSLVGGGADKTLLVFTAGVNCLGFGSLICISASTNPQMPTPTNTTTFTGTTEGGAGLYPIGATHLIVGTTTGMTVGDMLILDQLDDATDGFPQAGSIFVCGSGACTGQGQDTSRRSNRGQQQMVKIVTITDGTHLVTTPGLYMPNWRTGQTPGLSWADVRTSGDGVENLSLDGTSAGIGANSGANIVELYVSNCWVKGIRSVKDPRAHVWFYQSMNNTVRDSYLYGTLYAASTSYGVENYAGSSYNLTENVIFDGIVGGAQEGGGGVGNVWGYDFSINDTYTVSNNWMIPSNIQHSTGTTFILTEGNSGLSFEGDNIHGTHHFNTAFRNYFVGDLWNNPAKTNNTDLIHLWRYTRLYNMVGNVLGRAGYYANYAAPPGSTAIWSISGSPDPACTSNCVNDPFTASTLMRWGNYDNVTAAVHWCGNSSDTGWGTTCGSTSEVPTAIPSYSNPVPTLGDTAIGQGALPTSFYLGGTPTWWQFPSGTAAPFPAIGPDVSGGQGLAGHAYYIPAENCWRNVMGGVIGSSGLLSFNATACYGAAAPAPTVGLAPTSLAYGNQLVNTTSATQMVTLTNTGNANLVTTLIALQTGTQFAMTGATTCVLGGQTLAPGASCIIVVSFTPTSTGAKSDNVQITSNASTSVNNLALTGTGTQQASSYAPTFLVFGNQVATTTSAPQTVTLTNSGTANLITTNIALQTGTQFAITGASTCVLGGQTLAPAASCTIVITFTPTTNGAKSDNIRVTSNAPTSVDSVALSGTGISAGGQTLTPVLSPSTGVVPQVVTATSASSGTIIECWAISPTTPVTNGLGTGCNVGTAMVNGTTLVMSHPSTLNVVAGTSTLTDSAVANGVYTAATLGAYQPLAIAWQAPQPSDTTNFNNFVLNVLPHMNGIGISSTTATGNNLGNIYWSDIDNCFTTAPCANESTYAWPDTFIMSYVNATVGSNGTFANGCAGGTRCVIVMGIAPQQDSGTGVTKTPTYVMSHTYASSLGAADQDVSFASAWPGAVSGTWPGTVPCTNINTGNDACIANATNGCTAYGSATCGAVVGPPNASQNLSGFPVVYEVPIMMAYQKLLTALFLHYSAGGSGNGPTIAPYLQAGYVRIGLAAGAENNPGNVGSGAVTNGILAHTFWPGPKGLALEPAGFSQCGYLTNWLGSAQNGIGSCSALPNDGDGYVTAMDKFFASLNTNGIRISQSAHGGPPSNSNTFDATPVAPYADAESLLASVFNTGFGMQSARLADIVSYAGAGGPGQAANACTQNWCYNFQIYNAPVHHLVSINDGGATPHAAEFGINTITGNGSLATLNCTGTNGNSCEVFGNGTTILITGNSNANYNGLQVINCGGTCSAGTIQFSSSDASGGSGGKLWSPSYLPLLMPFASQRHATSLEIWECDLDYTYGATTSNVACGGNPGPDTTWQNAIINFQAGTPTSTTACKGTCAVKGTAQIK